MIIRDKILIIEDEETILRFMTATLTRSGYKVLKAQTGADAMLMIESHCPNLIILDLGLPAILAFCISFIAMSVSIFCSGMAS